MPGENLEKSLPEKEQQAPRPGGSIRVVSMEEKGCLGAVFKTLSQLFLGA